ncbi:MAG TPA: hypothetical protein VLX30_01360 [Burkholderiales bacterium]|nr:hypothetical protein [Burkholderiales bacterium]
MPKIAKFALACLLCIGVIGALVLAVQRMICPAYLPFGLSSCKEQSKA